MSTTPGAAATIALVGNGRSGTNWLLTMLDASPVTHCRSEPLDIATSLIHELPRPGVVGSPGEMTRAWSAFVESTRSTIGERDHTPPVPKVFYRPWAIRLGLAALDRRRGLNRLRRRLRGRYYRAERPMPFLLGSRRALAEAPCVMKLNDFHAAHLQSVLEIDPAVRFVHLVRHPGGYLDSAVRRHFGAMSPVDLQHEARRYRTWLDEGLAAGVFAADVLDDLADDTLAIVMRFWSANNEAIARLAGASPRYLRVLYEDTAAEPVAVAAAVYAHAGLAFDDSVRAHVEHGRTDNVWGDLSGSSRETAQRWERTLPHHLRELVDRELARSTMAGWWAAGRGSVSGTPPQR